ncbi:hypothetical protein GBF38_013810, partial [Nibea albiflora]
RGGDLNFPDGTMEVMAGTPPPSEACLFLPGLNKDDHADART